MRVQVCMFQITAPIRPLEGTLSSQWFIFAGRISSHRALPSCFSQSGPVTEGGDVRTCQMGISCTHAKQPGCEKVREATGAQQRERERADKLAFFCVCQPALYPRLCPWFALARRPEYA
ncbi:hypothetical protein ILYODFUR_026957 [Ilyodon furcidens]|uniref:Uncharacterized protein n=1 Tax=Ilyodon furcidens TaxID=33524 RepID=A0ABV0TD99_9TELE